MNPFQMRGEWSPLIATVYNAVIAPALRELYEEHIERFLADERVSAGTSLLDVGCGMGHALGIVARRNPQLLLTGVDLSQKMVQRARREHRGVANLLFQQGDAMALPFEPETFDLVMSTASIKHWPDPIRGLSQMYRVLKPAGRILVMEADSNCSRAAADNFVRRWRWINRLTLPVVTEYFIRFVARQGTSDGELESMLLSAGFEQVTLERITDLPAVVGRGVKTG
ncbi:MAG: class I SAM-dependent methyltransferase [Deltaproteobacteria bacterium]|nr:class I SAM-dependent methyltransferase [Deltaproteobacteria bacterium]